MEDHLVAFLIEGILDDGLVELKLFFAVDDASGVLARVHQMLGESFLLHVFLRLRNRLLHDSFDPKSVVWVVLPKVELEVADLSLSTLLFYRYEKSIV